VKVGELGSFLRSRREAITPAEVGLPVTEGRRTPGLRRAELATLASISIDYLIRIEQGRDTHPSARVLAALADALRLSEEHRSHLRNLVAVSHSSELCPSARPLARAVRPTVAAILAQLEPAPAYVHNHLFDVLAWTDGYQRLAGPLGLLDGGATPNLLRFTFTDKRAHAAYPHWDEVADAQVAGLRAEVYVPGGGAEQLAEELASGVGPAFSTRWQRAAGAGQRSGAMSVAQPEVGTLRLNYETLQLPDVDHQRLVVLLPADQASSARLDRLAGRQPGALRSVDAG
jgi:transcriptional regulator with XRE-family HTH domain